LKWEFEGSEHRPKIREFLAGLTELWEPDASDILMDEMWSGIGRFGVQTPFPNKPPHPHWKYLYRETFYPYLLNQRQALSRRLNSNQGGNRLLDRQNPRNLMPGGSIQRSKQARSPLFFMESMKPLSLTVTRHLRSMCRERLTRASQIPSL